MVLSDTPAIWRAAAVGPEPPVRRRSQFDPERKVRTAETGRTESREQALNGLFVLPRCHSGSGKRGVTTAMSRAFRRR
jgi:hypothetical protein